MQMDGSNTQSGPSIKNIDLTKSRKSLGKLDIEVPSYNIDDLILDDSKLTHMSPSYTGFKGFKNLTFNC